MEANKNKPPEAVAPEISTHTETAQIVSSMPKVQLQLCLGAMQRLAEEDPDSSRAFLQDNPQLCFALLHAQMLLDLDEAPLLPPSAEEKSSLLRANGMLPPGGLGIRPPMLNNPFLGLPMGMPMMGMPGVPFQAIPRPPMQPMGGYIPPPP